MNVDDLAMTQFGKEVCALAAKRGITTQWDLARTLERATGRPVRASFIHDCLRGRIHVPWRFLRLLDEGLDLTQEECHTLAQVFSWGETTRVVDQGA